MTQPFYPVTAANARSAEGVRAFELEILAYGQNAARVFCVADADPSCPLAQAYSALAHLFRNTREGYAQAAPYLRAARSLPEKNKRETLLCAALTSWHAEDQDRARATLTELAMAFPEDLFAAKLLQLLQFNNGDARGMLRTAAGVLQFHRGSGAAHGMMAFALDQTGDHAGAERSARNAIALGNDPWAHHALAHVFDASGRHAEGRQWMAANAQAWASCSSFLYTHNWWHAALFHLEHGDREGALQLYDERVWAVRKNYCQDQINAISLLARLELAGGETGDRWSEVAAYVKPRRTDAIDGFLDLHYAYALAKAGEDSALEDLLQSALEVNVPGAPRWRSLMPALIEGVAAFARGRTACALALLAPLKPSMYLIGGSTVQRDLFCRIIAAARGQQVGQGLAA